MISNIQALRAFAALGVVLYHTDLRIPGLLHTDYLGVAIFFVISGFIMSYIARTSAVDFLRRRIVRIVPLYWIGLLIYAGLIVVVYPMMGKQTDNIVTVSSFVQDMLFIPKIDGHGANIKPALQVGWTLNLEMYFYVLFAAAMMVSRKYAPMIAATVVAITWLAARSLNLPPMIEFWGHDYTIFFSLGVAAYFISRSVNFAPIIGIAVTLVGVAALGFYITGGHTSAHYSAPFLIVLGAVLLEQSNVFIKSPAILSIGTASYALYLFHPFVIGLGNTVAPTQRGELWLSTLLVFLAVTFALAIHRMIERPITDLIRTTRVISPVETQAAQ